MDIEKMTVQEKLELMVKALEVAEIGLQVGRDFIGSGLDGTTGGEEEYKDIKRCLIVVRSALKLK